MYLSFIKFPAVQGLPQRINYPHRKFLSHCSLLRTICLTNCILLIHIVHVFASPLVQEVDIVHLEGLSIPCKRCQIAENKLNCEMIVTIHNDSWYMPCEQGFTSLLSELASGHYDGEHPSPSELRTFLLDSSFTPQVSPTNSEANSEKNRQASLALELLFQTEKGQAILKAHAKQFLARYQPDIQKLIAERKGNPALWRSFWELPRAESSISDLRFHATIAGVNPEVSLSDLLGEVDSKDFRTAIFHLQIVEAVLAGTGGKWLQEIQETKRIVKECENQILETQAVSTLPGPCDDKVLKSENRAILAYLNRLNAGHQVSVVKSPPLPHGSTRGSFLLEAALFLGGAMVLGICDWKFRVRKIAKNSEEKISKQDALTFAEREELRRLLQNFQLSPLIGETQLTQTFRQLVKELHPDAGGKNPEEFIDLTRNYQRAKDLLTRR